MSRLLEWVKNTIDGLESEDVMVGVQIGATIFFVLLVATYFFALYGPVVVVAIFIFLLCIGMGVLIVKKVLKEDKDES